jgi:tRNA threonylcarbamoyl adenosine modification protein (Sua5/YciO/YrdC/YwlC family)
MAAELLKIYEENPQERHLEKTVQVLKDGGVIIYPTDTIYGMGCDIYNQKALAKLALIKNINLKKVHLSFICYDLSDISQYARISTPVFKVMKKALPGPFTFILKADSSVPKLFQTNKRTVGIRIPDNNIPRELVKRLGNPIVTTSIKHDDNILEYPTDPLEIYEQFKNLVDLVIDGGYGKNIASTVIDCFDDQFEVLRQGAGEIEEYV